MSHQHDWVPFATTWTWWPADLKLFNDFINDASSFNKVAPNGLKNGHKVQVVQYACRCGDMLVKKVNRIEYHE